MFTSLKKARAEPLNTHKEEGQPVCRPGAGEERVRSMYELKGTQVSARGTQLQNIHWGLTRCKMPG